MGNTSCCCSSSPSQQDYQDAIDNLFSVQEWSHIDELISYLDQLLNAIDQGSINSIGLLAKTNRVGSSINSGAGLLEKLLKRSNTHICKRNIVPTLNRETRRLVIDVTNEAAKIKWVGAVLSVVGFVLERIEQLSSNREDCIELLRYMCNLAKYIKQLDDHLPQEKLNRVLHFIVEGSLLCISQMQSHPLSKFFAAPVGAEDLQRLQRQLGQEYSELSLEAIIAVLNRIPVVLPPSQGTSPQAVGIEEARNRVTELLDMKSQSVKVVVIYGQGGIGKTTLASAVFSKLDLQNYKYCRVDIEQNCSEADLKLLQQQILRDLYGLSIELRSLNEGREELSKDFKEHSSKPVFIFVDNALKQSDLEKFLPVADLASLPPHSRNLITTRNLNETRVILQKGVERCHYLVASLPQEEARRLLCELALGTAQASFDSIVDINGLLKICQGIPLVLKMVGARLREHAQSMLACRDVVESLKLELLQGEEDDLSERMVDFVYNRLKASCKEAFLDIVFFSNWNMWRVGVTEFEELERAALVNITDEGMVNVHDIVKARGRMLSTDGERITDLQSLTDVLQDVERIKKTKGIVLLQRESFELEARHLNLMKRCLRVLTLSQSTRIVNGECKGAFENLWLLILVNHNYSWMDVSKYPRLTVLILEYNKDSDYPEFAGTFPSSLRFVSIRGATLVNLTITLSQNQSLHSLTLHNCSGFDSLPETISNLLALEELDLRSCSSLVSLPDSFGSLSSLEKLYLRFCHSLVSLPDSFGSLSSLKKLHLGFCSSLVSLPDSFGSLSSLKKLHLGFCSSLVSLPDSFGSLSSLNELHLESCSRLVSLPDSFGSLSSLNELLLRSCSSLVSLPDSFGNLYGLVNLYLIRCTHLSLLPESFGNLASVERLFLQECEKLWNLPQNLGQLKCLKYVSVHGCSVLQSLSGDFECLSSLFTVQASECSQLEENTMDKLAKMKGLMVVDIGGSPMLKKRWEQVKEQYSLAVVECGRQIFRLGMYPHADVMRRAFFHSESKFMHVDENGQLVESACTAGGVKLWLLLKEGDMNVRDSSASSSSSSSSNSSRCWEAVKKKWMELVGSEGGQMIYVDMGGSWEEIETRVQQALPHLPSGTRAWIAPDNRARLQFAHSVEHYYDTYAQKGDRKGELRGVQNCIVSTSVYVDEEGRPKLDDFKFIHPTLVQKLSTNLFLANCSPLFRMQLSCAALFIKYLKISQ